MKTFLEIPISKLLSSGFLPASGKTMYYNHNHGNWSDGPKLIKERYDHAAGIVTDEATLDVFVVVTGGTDGSYSYDVVNGSLRNILNSTEILVGGVWSIGKKDFLSAKQREF